MTDLTRRSAIAVGCACGVAGLAACAGGGQEPASSGLDGTEGSGGAGESGAGGSAVALADVPVGSGATVQVDGAFAIVTQPAEGEVHAFSAVCTHQGCQVAAGDGTIACPCHGSEFDLTTGEATHGPATEALTPMTATIEGDRVVVTA